MSILKAYFYVVIGGLAVVAGVAFTALQWGTHSRFSAFGPEMRMRTAYFVVLCAVGGMVVYWMVRLLVRGAAILIEERRRERRILSKARKEGGG